MIQLFKASESDVETIREIAFKIWPKHYIPIIGESQVKYMLDTKYSSSTIQLQIRSNSHDYFILTNELKQALGFAAFQKTDEKRYFLDKFYILDSEQGKGLGYLTLNQLIQHYRDLSELRLQVNRKNYKAINFYFKFGFKIEKVEDFDIGEGFFMNDFVMLYKKAN